MVSGFEIIEQLLLSISLSYTYAGLRLNIQEAILQKYFEKHSRVFFRKQETIGNNMSYIREQNDRCRRDAFSFQINRSNKKIKRFNG